MGKLALRMLGNSMEALINNDIKLAKEVLQKKEFIREYDYKIEKIALRLIALHQPMAIDLRILATILKIITYLTRIGRYGKDISSVVKEIHSYKCPRRSVNLQHIWEHVRDMIINALDAFDKADVNQIKDFSKRDSEVDELRWSIFREGITFMMEDPKCITPYAHYIMIARYLERCGDHACKMGEKIYYMVTGSRIEIK